MKKIFAIILAILLNTSISYSKNINDAYFAGGCFWCVEEFFEKTNGARTIPQIFIGDTYVGGYNELKALEVAGKLNSLLEN